MVVRGNKLNPVILLLLLGAAFEAIYIAVFAAPFFLPSFYSFPKLDLGWVSGGSLVGGSRFALAVVLLFALYYLGWKVCRAIPSSPRAFAVVFTFSIIFASTLVFMYPVNSQDVFYSIMAGRTTAFYGQNPYFTPSQYFPNDPFYPYAGWLGLKMPYGPLWALMSALLSRLGDSDILATLLYYKGFLALAYLATGLLIYVALSETAPQYRLAGASLWLWNPLVVIETAGNAHNDALVMAVAILAFYLLIKNRPALALAFLTLSVLLKFVTLLLMPVFIWHLLRQEHPVRIKGATLGWSLAWGLALVVAAFGPFWVGSATIGFWGEYKFVSVGVAGAIKFLLQPFFGVKASVFAVIIATGLALAAFALLVWRARRTYPSEAANLAWLCYRVLAIFAIFAVPWFHPWYLTWVVALGALLPAVPMARQLAVFTAGGLMLYLAQFYASQYWWGLPPSLAEILWSLALLAVGLGAAVLAVWIYAFRQTLTWTGLTGAPYRASVEEMVLDSKRTIEEAEKEVAD